MKKWFNIILFLLLLFIFSYLRLKSIINETIPYTYDQGRDFLKAEEIVRFKNLTFIGPTTGIMGIYHGAWWYYLLSIPYFVFNGWPMGFYYFMFLISLIGNISFFYFLKKEFSLKTAFLFLAIVSVSPYFIPLSFFVSNNIITPYIILAFIVSIYYLFKTKKLLWLLLTGLMIAFIHEFEVAFGLFFIPFTIFLMLIFKTTKKLLASVKGMAFFVTGIFIAFLPRILFEIKNNFIQTKTLINFFLKPKLHNPKLVSEIFKDRISLFINYFKGIFIDYNSYLTILILLITIVVFLQYNKTLKKYSYLLFINLLILLLFIGSLFYKDNFWSNYYEGIQYLMLFILLIAFFILEKKGNIINVIIFTSYIMISCIFLTKELKNKNNEIKDFKAIDTAIKYLYNKNSGQNFCLKIYTPPVVPYTYDYLTSYYSKIKNINRPLNDYIDNKCYFIIETDNYRFRIKEWRKNNIPKNGSKLSSYKVNKDIEIELWQR